MKIETLEGIILSETNYSESSKILNVLTKEYGLIGVISKGCRNIKSKLRSVSRKLIYGNIHVYYKKDGLSILISVDVINSFPKTSTDLEKISYASYLLDLTKQVIRQNDSSEIYNLLKDTLLKIEEGFSPLILTNILELKFLDYLGVRPNIDNCGICGNTKNIVSLSADSGGYVCLNCQTNEPKTSEKVIKMIRMYYYVEIKNITKLDVSEEVSKAINKFLDDYYDRYTGLYLKTKNFIKQVQKISA